MCMSYLSLIDVEKTYASSAPAVRHVSLEIERGEFVTFLGPSGSGKTTTLSMVAGFILPSSGRIEVGGQDITHVPPHQRNIGMVFQDYSLFPHMTVEENIAFPLRMRGMSKRDITSRAGEALEIVGLSGFGHRLPVQLSGGQQQRVAIARAIVYRPAILLMDEPLGALDRLLRDRLQLEIKQIQREMGITTLYVTHDQGEALTMSDRICVFNEGEVVQVGTPSSIYEKPSNVFVAGFVGESNFLECRVLTRRSGSLGNTYVLAFPDSEPVTVQSECILPVHGEATAVVRPEHIRVEPTSVQPQPTEAAIQATIRDIIYRGESSSLQAVLRSGQTVTVRIPSRSVVLSPNQEVHLVWETRDTVLLPNDRRPEAVIEAAE
jgi:putative spermidine/putrescine transport system ATP-binding protein